MATFDPNSANISVFSILGEDYPTIAQGDRPTGTTTYVYGTSRLAFIPNDIRRYNFPGGVHILGQAGLGAHRGTTWDLQVACDQGRLKIYGIEPGTIITDGAYYDSCWYRAKNASGQFIDNSILGSFIDESAAQWNREHQEGGGNANPATSAAVSSDVLRALSALNTGMTDLKSQVQTLQAPTPTALVNPKVQAAADAAIVELIDAGLNTSGGGHWVVTLRNLAHMIKGV